MDKVYFDVWKSTYGLIMIFRLTVVTVPLDAFMLSCQLVNTKIVPDKKVGEDRKLSRAYIEQVIISLLPALLPFRAIFEVIIITVIYLSNRGKHHRTADTGSAAVVKVILQRLGRRVVLNTAMYMGINDHFNYPCCRR